MKKIFVVTIIFVTAFLSGDFYHRRPVYTYGVVIKTSNFFSFERALVLEAHTYRKFYIYQKVEPNTFVKIVSYNGLVSKIEYYKKILNDTKSLR